MAIQWNYGSLVERYVKPSTWHISTWSNDTRCVLTHPRDERVVNEFSEQNKL